MSSFHSSDPIPSTSMHLNASIVTSQVGDFSPIADLTESVAAPPQNSELEPDLVELIGLVVALEHQAPHTIAIQRELCLARGIDAHLVESLVDQRTPMAVNHDYALAIGLTRWLLTYGEVAPHLRQRSVEDLGAEGLDELVRLVSFRSGLSSGSGFDSDLIAD